MPLPQPIPDLVSLDLLASVATLGSIRQAAIAHGISQPAASTRLRVLEGTLGLELLNRSSGGRSWATCARCSPRPVRCAVRVAPRCTSPPA